MELEKILVVNDDTDVIVAMQKRLPDNVQVVVASQFGAQQIKDYSVFDFVLLDNDANNLNESKGAKTLEHIRKTSDISVFYTSFQPSMVPEQVYKTKGVQVVRTEEALPQIAKLHGLELKPEVKREGVEPETSIILTYNPVEGYKSGVFGNGKLIIASNTKYGMDRAKDIVLENVKKLYSDFEWSADRDKIKNIFVYDGVNGGERPGQMAADLGHDIRMVVQMMACGCDWKRKVGHANSTYVELNEVECSGRNSLGMVADVILGVTRPSRGYTKLVMPEQKILTPAQRWTI